MIRLTELRMLEKESLTHYHICTTRLVVDKELGYPFVLSQIVSRVFPWLHFGTSARDDLLVFLVHQIL